MNASDQRARDRAPSRVGQVLRGKWRLDALLAVGGMASVYAATHRNGKRGAVKLLHYDVSLNEESRTRFLREGYVANRVDHEGAVSVLDDDVCEDGTVFLVMELLDGQTLDALMRIRNARTFGLGETLRVADRLLDVLAAAHEKGVVHRDIKPENIFVTRQGRLKVLDFGIARLRESTTHAGVTRAGDLLGTPSFMSPEQALGNMDAVDARSDIWSVGATMFRLLTGRPVHEAESINRVLLAAMTLPAQPIRRVLPTIPAPLAAIVDQSLAFEQKDRWQDSISMRAAILAYAEHERIRMDGPVLNTPEEAKARPYTLPLEQAPQAQALAARPAPAAGRPAYTSPEPGVHNAAAGEAPSDMRAPVAPVPFATGFSGAPSPGAAATGQSAPAMDMSVTALLPDADDGDDDAKTNLRDPIAVPPVAFAPAAAPAGSPAPVVLQPPPPVGPMQMPVAMPSATGERPMAPHVHTPSFNTSSGAVGDRPITLAPAHTPSFHTASPVSRDPTFAHAPRSTKMAPFVVLGAVAVLGALAAVVLIGGRSSTPEAEPAAPVTTPVTAGTPEGPAPTEPPPTASAPTTTAAPDPVPTAATPAAPPATTPATAKTPPTAKPAPSAAPKPSATTSPKPGPKPKSDPFSSRKW